MIHPTSSNPLEQQAARYFDDGLFDIVLGMGLLLCGIFIAGGGTLAVLAAILPALTIALMPALKKRITIPRLRSSDVPPDMERRLRQAKTFTIVVIAAMLLLSLLALALARTNILPPITLPSAGVAGGIAGLLLVLLGFFGWASGARRFSAYIVLAILAAACGFWLQLGIETSLVALGAIIALCGLTILIRFIRNHPRP